MIFSIRIQTIFLLYFPEKNFKENQETLTSYKKLLTENNIFIRLPFNLPTTT